ncbi:unnamed protein product [Closterium sp. NIES-53]
MGNMTMTSGSRRPRVRMPSPEPARHPIGAFSNNNPFSPCHDFSDNENQDWNLPVPLLEIPPQESDILLHYTVPNKARKQIGRAHSENRVYILDFDIPDCSDDSQELIDLIPLLFEHIHRLDWKNPDCRPWVPHHPHPRELALHDPDPNGICRDCHTPIVSTSAISGSSLAAIAEAERLAPPEEGISTLELEIATPGIFGTEEHPLPGPVSQHLQGMLRGTGVGTFDEHRVPRTYTKEKFMEIYSHQRDSTKKLTVAQEEELAQREAEEVRRQSLGEWGAATGSNTGGWGAAYGDETNGWGTSGEGWGASREDQRGEEKEEAEPPVVPLGRPPRSPAPALPPPDIQPHRDPWDTIDWGNKPSTPWRTVYGPDPKPREPTFALGTILGTNIPFSVILDREFLALMLTTTNEEEEAEEAAAKPAQVPDKDPAGAHARYMRTSGFRANDDLWHQRLGHPSCVTLKNCIKAGVFAPGALLRPDGTKVRSTTHARNCTVCLEAALSHRPFPLLEPGTNHYPNLIKVYGEFLNVGHCGINDELYTLTFVDAGTRYVLIVDVEARSRAYKFFRLWLAHEQRQSGEKLKIWQSDGAAEFRSKELQNYLAQKGIKHHISLPYAHQQQGVAERTNRTLMAKVRALMKQSKLPPTYWTYAMHHAVRVHNLVSTIAITSNLSSHLKWTGTKGDTSMLRAWGCMVQYRPTTSTIGKLASRARWGIHLGISHEHKAWLILYLMSQKVANARDIIFYERRFL